MNPEYKSWNLSSVSALMYRIHRRRGLCQIIKSEENDVFIPSALVVVVFDSLFQKQTQLIVYSFLRHCKTFVKIIEVVIR